MQKGIQPGRLHRKIIIECTSGFFPTDEKSHDSGGCATFASSKIREKWSESVKSRATFKNDHKKDEVHRF